MWGAVVLVLGVAGVVVFASRYPEVFTRVSVVFVSVGGVGVALSVAGTILLVVDRKR
jgi:membrane-anchored protein YejM (alkaline phosphatase superfamily)